MVTARVISDCTNTYFDNLWVTTDTPNGDRSTTGWFNTSVIENFILQVGTTNVYGQSFGNRIANKPLVLNEKSITYGSKTTSKWGVDEKGRDTQFIIKNRENGDIQDLTVNGGWLHNDGYIQELQQNAGHVCNRGCIMNYRLSGGGLENGDGKTDNGDGCIRSLYWSGGTITSRGNTDQIIDLRGLAA
ncbi:MAG: hypothetical protein FWG73_07155 [Planctomycetaceae bacterium]|nr:hypothetical protein [Planctomycetaceae bacterium]